MENLEIKEAEEVENAKVSAKQKKVAKETAEKLAKLNKVEIKIPLDELNKEDKYVAVCINGHIIQIERGVKVRVPEAVKDILEDAGYI